MKINFSKKVYNSKAVKGAIKEYKHLAEFSVAENKSDISVTAGSIDADIADVFQDEFCNYVLALMKK